MSLKKTAAAILLLILCLLQSCRKEVRQEVVTAPAKHITQPVSNKESTGTVQDSAFLVPHEERLEGYTFKYGYTAYDEEKYGFSNPGYFEVLKGGSVIFKDAFKGEGEPYITSLGRHSLDGDKLVFQLHYGTEACDYTHTARYYVADAVGNFRFIKDYSSFTGGDQYASRYFMHILPKDSLGKPNTLTIVEGITYHEHDQPDRADTTHVVFSGSNFKVIKLSDNLSKAE